ncbi:biosynthetic-type acetolactate synthase large subunit [Methanospirillum lacunae]|uniref:Acetolactate synthase n=1 Tax=Methanospirillum lacunae TaxID=668570 RepID=A0A2V2N833_9EURY|nr:biosynthetic-type acetolactate synthase large subunit [Methanospirillum lacunae]PWR72668.1 biosynthetic-type acetolactate synthase large subunit [Methanospirillum lacunae]
MRTGAKILLDSLEFQGVETIFGYPGATVLPIYDELPKSGIRHILVRHEQAAAHAADGYARAGGGAGVCLATSGPGACNLVTGIATAYMDSIPVIAITGQVPTDQIGNQSFQEANITEITRPVTKQNYLVTKTADLAKTVSQAFSVAMTGRPGPVLIDIPKDVSTGLVSEEKQIGLRTKIIQEKQIDPNTRRLCVKAVEMISNAETPIILAGGGVISSHASEEIQILANRFGIPVTTTLLGIGTIPSDNPLNLGMIGMHGTIAANHAVDTCDLLIAIGTRFSDRSCGTGGLFAPHAAVIHVDIDPGEIGKNRTVDLSLIGDAKDILQEIIRKIRRLRTTIAWRDQINIWKHQADLSPISESNGLYPQQVIRTLASILKGRGIIVSEVGQNQMWTAQNYRFQRPRSFLTSGGLGTMGFGLPAAMGASFACPDQQICTIAGDGSLQMNIQEFATLAEYKIPVKILVLNNQYLGMVRQWQELFYARRYSFTELPSIEFTKIAAAYGIEGVRVDSPEEIPEAIKDAFTTKGPFLIDFRILREENVFPMVPAGAKATEMIFKNTG